MGGWEGPRAGLDAVEKKVYYPTTLKLLLQLKNYYPTVAGNAMTTVCFIADWGRW
jgi:hypothetical protein